MVLGLALILFVLSSGSILCAAAEKQRYEQILPVTCVGVVAVLFLCGILGGLRYGITLVFLIALALWVCGVVILCRRKNLKEFLRRVFTPGFFLWAAFLAVAMYHLPGMLFCKTDEFSHWGSIVKGMFYFDQLSTAPVLESAFASYPPGLAVFEYFTAKVMAAAAHTDFQEWYVYLGWQSLVFSMMMPFTAKLRFRNPLMIAAVGLILFVSPSVLDVWIYSTVYADSALGVLLGAGLAMVAVNEQKDSRWYLLFVCSICFLLVLTKDVGLLFAIMLWIAFSVDLGARRSFRKKALVPISLAGISIALPKLLWNGSILKNHAVKNFGSAYDWAAFWQILTGKDHTYRGECWSNYWKELFATGQEFHGITIPSVHLMLLLIFLLICVVLIIVAWKWDRGLLRSVAITVAAAWINCLVYIVGLAISYLFKFSQPEAMELASFNRYLRIVHLSIWLYLVCTGAWIFTKSFQGNRLLCAGVLCLALVMVPISTFKNCITRSDVAHSVDFRAPYQELFQLAREAVPADERILVIQEGDMLGLEISCGLLPAHTDLFQEGQSLDGYDYVLLLTDQLPFDGETAALFDHVEANSLYRKMDGRFVRCG